MSEKQFLIKVIDKLSRFEGKDVDADTLYALVMEILSYIQGRIDTLDNDK